MKVLIITYYWPPAGGSGVQRWLKFVKYLRDFNIEPIIYTVQNTKYAIEDSSLLAEVPDGIEVLRQPIFEPNSLFSSFGKKNKKQSSGFLNPNPSFFGRIIQYIRANYFIPDARKFWIKPSVKYLTDYLQKHHVDAIISTGPPHSMHMIAMLVKEKTGIKWISDFRDPWTEIDYFHQLPLTKRSKSKHLELEKKVITSSDALIVVGETMKESFDKLNSNIHVITNGFDEESRNENVDIDSNFTITHIGMMNADRNPTVLWEALKEIVKKNDEFRKDLKIQLVGKIAPEVEESIRDFDENNIVLIDYVNHQEAKVFQRKSQLLLLAINNVPSAKGILTGKLFEYLQANRPILGVGPTDGDAAEIIKRTNSGIMIDFDAAAQMKEEILRYYEMFKNAELNLGNQNIKKYHRKELTKELSEILASLMK